jgi:hypothetical protein
VGRLVQLLRKMAAVASIVRSQDAYQVCMDETLPMGQSFANRRRGWEKDYQACDARGVGGKGGGVTVVTNRSILTG